MNFPRVSVLFGCVVSWCLIPLLFHGLLRLSRNVACASSLTAGEREDKNLDDFFFDL